MRFVRFEKDGRRSVGVQREMDGVIFDISSEGSPVSSMRTFIERGQEALEQATQAMKNDKSIGMKPDEVKLLAPIDDPDKLICIGMNYRDHCEEQNLPVPEEPVVFSKFNSSICGPYDAIVYPEETNELDWEVELAIVVGKGGKNIPEQNAMDYVFGYTVAHDVSARDWQLHRNGNQFLLGKSMDFFCPLGPAIVTTKELKDPHNLKLWTKVNGVTKQESATSQLVFKTPTLISFLSRFFTLKPGDVILTGTPPGVGVFRNPPEFLKRGDVVEVGIEGIGSLINEVK